MNINNFLDILITLLPIIGIGGFFFLYYKNQKTQSITKKILKFAPFILSFLVSIIPDKKNVFDKHDMVILITKLSTYIRETINDPTNADFNDVQEELFNFIRSELDNYKKIGLKNVPDINNDSIRIQIKVVFDSFQRIFRENSSGSNNTN